MTQFVINSNEVLLNLTGLQQQRMI